MGIESGGITQPESEFSEQQIAYKHFRNEVIAFALKVALFTYLPLGTYVYGPQVVDMIDRPLYSPTADLTLPDADKRQVVDVNAGAPQLYIVDGTVPDNPLTRAIKKRRNLPDFNLETWKPLLEESDSVGKQGIWIIPWDTLSTKSILPEAINELLLERGSVSIDGEVVTSKSQFLDAVMKYAKAQLMNQGITDDISQLRNITRAILANMAMNSSAEYQLSMPDVNSHISDTVVEKALRKTAKIHELVDVEFVTEGGNVLQVLSTMKDDKNPVYDQSDILQALLAERSTQVFIDYRIATMQKLPIEYLAPEFRDVSKPVSLQFAQGPANATALGTNFSIQRGLSAYVTEMSNGKTTTLATVAFGNEIGETLLENELNSKVQLVTFAADYLHRNLTQDIDTTKFLINAWDGKTKKYEDAENEINLLLDKTKGATADFTDIQKIVQLIAEIRPDIISQYYNKGLRRAADLYPDTPKEYDPEKLDFVKIYLEGILGKQAMTRYEIVLRDDVTENGISIRQPFLHDIDSNYQPFSTENPPSGM